MYQSDRHSSTVSPSARKEAEGFSLLEVTLAIMILTGLTLYALVIVVPVSSQIRISREVSRAAGEVQKILEEVQSTPFFQVTKEYPNDTVIEIDGLDQGKIVVSYDDPDADPLIMTATLTWESPDLGSMSRIFTTVRTE